jgi:hypothetical protein
MQLGRHLRELWRLRIGLVASVLLAVFAGLWSVGRVSLIPPSVQPRALETAAASTRVLVDAPRSTVLDLSVDTYNFQAITNRALLVGNVMASEPVQRYIGRRARVSPDVLQVASPVTPDFPRPLASSGKRSSRDILKSPDEYRLSIQVNPTAPVLDVYAEAPTAEAAELLANGAVDGMKDYLRDLGTTQGVPLERQVRLEQLGRAKGGVINQGVRVKLAVLSFLLVFAACSLTVLFIGRVRRGWAVEAERDRERDEAWVTVMPDDRLRPAGEQS